MDPRPQRIFLAGAASYVGRHLLTELEARDYRVRCLLPASLRFPVSGPTEVVVGDPCNAELLSTALRGIETAFWMACPTASDGPFASNDCRSAFTFASAARQAGVKRILYTSGLKPRAKYSGHAYGPDSIGEALRQPGVPVVEMRSSLIIGAGSLAFRIIRELVENRQVIALPGWSRTPVYPISVEDLVSQLVAGLEASGHYGRVIELGGAERASFSDLMQEYARQRQLRRIFIPIPLLMPRLSILSLSLVAPTFARFGQELVATLCSRTLAEFPQTPDTPAGRLQGVREMIQGALAHDEPAHPPANERRPEPSTASAPRNRFGLRIVDVRSRHVPYVPGAAFRPIERIGGKTGWYYANWLWRLRGVLDVLMGGRGMRKGRRHAEELAVGDPVDMWRVEAIERGHLLRLAAEMKLPGRAWLQFEVDSNGTGSRIRQTAIFDPVGVTGLLYWYTLYPAHEMIFPGLLKGIARAIPSTQGPEESPAIPPGGEPA